MASPYEHLQWAQQEVDSSERHVRQTEAAARLAKQRYRQGLADVREPLRAQTEVISAKVNLLNARYQLTLACADLRRLATT